MLDACERGHVAFGLARAGDHVREILRRSGLAQRIGESNFYTSVNEAVTALVGEPQPPA